MSDPILSAPVLSRLAGSLPFVEKHKHTLIDRMEEGLAAEERYGEPFGQAEITAMMLVEMLLVHARNLVEGGTLGNLRAERAEHEMMGIGGRHYSRFGDLLVAVMKDLLGPRVPTEVPAAWCSAFWTIIRQMQDQRDVVHA